MTLREIIRLYRESPSDPVIKVFMKQLWDSEHLSDIETYKSIISAWTAWDRQKSAGSLAKFLRLADSVRPNETSSGADEQVRLEDFIVSVFLALEQPINLDMDTETFSVIHRIAHHRQEEYEKSINTK